MSDEKINEDSPRKFAANKPNNDYFVEFVRPTINSSRETAEVTKFNFRNQTVRNNAFLNGTQFLRTTYLGEMPCIGPLWLAFEEPRAESKDDITSVVKDDVKAMGYIPYADEPKLVFGCKQEPHDAKFVFSESKESKSAKEDNERK